MVPRQDYSDKALPEISAFSKHLMLLIITVFAMLTPLLFNSNNIHVKSLLYITLLIVLVGLYFGHRVLTIIIELYLDPGKDKIDFHTTKPIINALRFQFFFSILSAVLLVITYGYNVLDVSNVTNDNVKIISNKIKLLEHGNDVSISNQKRLDLLQKQYDGNNNEIKNIILGHTRTQQEIELIKIDQKKIKNQCEFLLKNQNIKQKNRTRHSSEIQ